MNADLADLLAGLVAWPDQRSEAEVSGAASDWPDNFRVTCDDQTPSGCFSLDGRLPEREVVNIRTDNLIDSNADATAPTVG